MNAVLAPDLAQFRFNADAAVVAPVRDLCGGGSVLLITQVGSVVHDRREPQRDGLPDQSKVLRMIKVHDDARGAFAGDRQRGESDRLQVAAMELDGVLGDLQDRR